MRSAQVFIALVMLSCLVACSKQPTQEASNRDLQPNADIVSAENPVGEAQDASGLAQETPDAEMDYGDWLKLPDTMDSRYQQAYPPLVKSAMQGDPIGQVNLALASQQIASVLARTGENEAFYPFLLQSARALRAALPTAVGQVPESTIGNIFFNEASVLGHAGQTELALSALNDAVEHGFTNLAAIEKDENLAALRQSEGYDAQLEKWRALVAEKFRAHAVHDLAAGKTFPFELSATDVNGATIDLAQLTGQVVIVDIWGTWCPPCRAEVPFFIRLQDKFHEQGFTMIGLNYEKQSSEEENLAAVVDYVKQVGINYPCIMGTQETLAQVPDFSGYPTTLFIDKTGTVRLKAVGLHPYEYLEAVVTELLNE